MEKDKMMQILVPVAAIAAIAVIVALILGQSSPDPDNNLVSKATTPIPPPAHGKSILAEVPSSTEGCSLDKPDLSAPEWKDSGDGLKVWEVKEGEGDARIRTTDEGFWHYTGWRPDGFIFDSSVRRGSPTPFGLTQVIKGWTIGLAGMKVGGIRRLYIPSPLAYGAQAKGNDIPANTDLIFEVKLIRISR